MLGIANMSRFEQTRLKSTGPSGNFNKLLDLAAMAISMNYSRMSFMFNPSFAMGDAYINFMMEEGDERIKATYGENYERLVQIKNKYDPSNLFRVNQNIKPEA